MGDLRHLNIASEDVGHELHKKHVASRKPTSQNHLLDRRAAGSEVIDDRSCAEAKGLQQSSVYVRPACPQIHSEKKAAHGRIPQWNAVAVPPRHSVVSDPAAVPTGLGSPNFSIRPGTTSCGYPIPG